MAAPQHAAAAVRRSPFSSNSQVGARGQRTQQRILDAALAVFGEEGYHRAGIARIARAAGCSRASFYQYFSSKEDVFRHLAGQVARQLTSAGEALPALTADPEGWEALRGWVRRHAEVYDRYEPVFRAHDTAAHSDDVMAIGSERAGSQIMSMFGSRLAEPPLPPRQLDPVLRMLLHCVTAAQDVAGVLSSASPDTYSREALEVALTDLLHRTLFGHMPGVNAHHPIGPAPRPIRFGSVMRDPRITEAGPADMSPAARRTLETLMDAGREVFVRRGYDATRVDDIATEAGVSHGAFYRHFRNKDHLAQVLAIRAMRTVSEAFATIPDRWDAGAPPDRAALRAWVRRYNASAAREAAVIRVWVEASYNDPSLAPGSAAALDWGRRRLAAFLAPRGFGDPEVDALLALALLNSLDSHELSPTEVDAAGFVVERGLLGEPGVV